MEPKSPRTHRNILFSTFMTDMQLLQDAVDDPVRAGHRPEQVTHTQEAVSQGIRWGRVEWEILWLQCGGGGDGVGS